MYDLTAMRVEIDEHIALVTFDKPPVNAQNFTFQEEVKACFDQLSVDDAVRAVVLTGAGRVFSAGTDLHRTAPVTRDDLRSARESFHAIVECRKPVIGALNGPALGSGLTVAASCDLLIASQTASLGLPEIDVGLMGGGRHAQRLFSHSLLRRMALTGYRVPAPELYRLGIVEACVEPDALIPTAMDLAREIASKSPLAVQLFKRTLNTIEYMSLRDGYRYEQEMTLDIRNTQDAEEAMRAFVEKRKPVFTGR
ncbi:enoyl-CoA hydratase/isomerase family protein [Sphingobium sp. 15-1]|uniref:enoyl-CoA hydratase/isomerase family protein n=1 Tax=Sphingobium sp. 15-1 TaxID=2729616 RepID=UPI00159CBB2F|nr:enoyl-CoA hydratase/isomerase family protein [Sphingobium sp. 15-1]